MSEAIFHRSWQISGTLQSGKNSAVSVYILSNDKVNVQWVSSLFTSNCKLFSVYTCAKHCWFNSFLVEKRSNTHNSKYFKCTKYSFWPAFLDQRETLILKTLVLNTGQLLLLGFGSSRNCWFEYLQRHFGSIPSYKYAFRPAAKIVPRVRWFECKLS